MSRVLEGDAQSPLMARTRASLATRLDLTAIRKIAVQARDIFIVDLENMIDAERADLAPPEVAPTAAKAPTATITATITEARSFTTITEARSFTTITATVAKTRPFAWTLIARAITTWAIIAWGAALAISSLHATPRSYGNRRLS
jgi:hypothetical protein